MVVDPTAYMETIMPMKFNWQLWDNFVAAAEELNLPLVSNSGRCVRIALPGGLDDRFYSQIWTPLNKLEGVYSTLMRKGVSGGWEQAMKQLLEMDKCGHDFHLEFGGKGMDSGDQYWFPNLMWHKCQNATKQELVDALRVMLDVDNYASNRQHALFLQELSADQDEIA